ncbi:hypothetical protein WJX72_002580 [[Myrmecia] bisecta]|uniref:Hexosyltransferase n=1 Tax=[Myrmecia] bisecta TaxID=41462 RepID=A0AAW1PKZ2_9CHLO
MGHGEAPLPTRSEVAPAERSAAHRSPTGPAQQHCKRLCVPLLAIVAICSMFLALQVLPTLKTGSITLRAVHIHTTRVPPEGALGLGAGPPAVVQPDVTQLTALMTPSAELSDADRPLEGIQTASLPESEQRARKRAARKARKEARQRKKEERKRRKAKAAKGKVLPLALAPPPPPAPIATHKEQQAAFDAKAELHFVQVACGDRLDELVTSLKSFLAFALSPQYGYHVHILTNGIVTPEHVAFLQPASRFRVSIHGTYEHSAGLFRECASERLYLHEHPALLYVKKMIYIDTDVIWLDDAAKLAQWFDSVHPERIYGLAEETLPPQTGWYLNGRAGDLPFWGRSGLNSGIMAVNADLLRMSTFSSARDEIIAYWGNEKQLLTLGDQDVLNVYFHDRPEEVAIMPCGFNFRHDCGCQLDQLPVAYHGNDFRKRDSSSAYFHHMMLYNRLNATVLQTHDTYP